LLANDIPNGKGKLINDTFALEGVFTNGKLIGKRIGTKTFKDKSTYKGEMNEKNQADGIGELTFNNGSKIKGKFVKDIFQSGDGEIIINGGIKYIGKLGKYAKPNGQGKKMYANGSYASGKFVNGIFSGGTGVMNDKNGYYTGELNANAQAEGHGKYVFKNGSYVSGTFRNNRFAFGKGVIFENGVKRYEGGMDKDFKPHGRGTAYLENLDGYYKATFNHGSFTKAYGNISRGRSHYEGELNNKLQPHGDGTWNIPDGSKRKEISGVFVNGKLDKQATIQKRRQAMINNRNSDEKRYNIDEKNLVNAFVRFTTSNNKSARVVWSGWYTFPEGSHSLELFDKGVFKKRKLMGNYRLWVWQAGTKSNLKTVCLSYKTNYYQHNTDVFGNTNAVPKTSQTKLICPSWNKLASGGVVTLGFTTHFRSYKNFAIFKTYDKVRVFVVLIHE